MSRGWRGVRDHHGEPDTKVRDYISRVGLLIMDEVHLLGEERGVSLYLYARLTSVMNLLTSFKFM